MATAKLKSPAGADQGTVDLPDAIFDAKINRHIMWESVVNYLANQRLGTAKVKTRSEVSGGGAKPWRQKGTGRARAGSSRTNIWVGGGRVHGPEPRDHYYKLPQKIRTAALKSAFTVRAKDGDITIITDSGVNDGRTKEVVSLLSSLGVNQGKCLLVVDGAEPKVTLAGRNLRAFDTTNAHQVNTYEVLWADHVLITQSALDTLKEARA